MKFLLYGIILFLFLSETVNGDWYVKDYSDPKHPGKCVIEGHILSPGQKIQPLFECKEYACYDEDGLGDITGCGPVNVPSNCKMDDYDYSQPHPKCCHRDVRCG
ncbi:uncharacterized protein LOC119670087 [Teleopsis dalmanni]|uniref:uncharacterized protein LOC119668894 n=1 Tax=Teleopsis dalmanni TaxID=139649 RepID=UPI0018CEA028|nr:uncharacterized protein LOC119668894 [Teleopsis dalmanni]XP_037936132.1 uncharacterized protein LOC119670087 [Teleopsis dalmanni]